ncbi:MAG: Nif3-like dinuclear metal center hexameric protein [Bacteroidota bacterium]
MTIADIEQIVETWAPKWTAWERDNVGLQLGDRTRKISKVLVALDVTEQIVQEARSKKVELIVSHHPLLFRPPSSITTANEVGRMVLKLAESKIAVYSAHTNVDFARDGVSFTLAKTLGLRSIRFLSPLKETLAKVVVFVPAQFADSVADAMSSAGAGIIGNYLACSFQSKGTGTFCGSAQTKPYAGKAGNRETVDEVRLEMIAPRARTNDVIAAMKRVHPYEEVAYDLYHLDNEDPNYGMGAVGTLTTAQSLKSFLERTKRVLHAASLCYSGDLRKQVKTVAVCGGSGSDLLSSAVNAKADVFVTADVRYHTFHEARTIALVDAGHWETERVILEPLAARLRQAATQMKKRLDVSVTKYSTNPIHTI